VIGSVFVLLLCLVLRGSRRDGGSGSCRAAGR
jgi:hypothetical protein